MILTNRLLETCVDDSQRETLRTILYGINLMSLLVQNLSDFQHLKMGTLVVRESALKLREFVIDTVETF